MKMTTRKKMESSSAQIRSSLKNQRTTVAPVSTMLVVVSKKRRLKNLLSVTILIKLPSTHLKRIRMMKKRRDAATRVSKNALLVSP